jgi:Holliday junction resolvasome RuvABC endonuclease subunit
MKVLGLDSGMTRLGFGLVKAEDDNLELLSFGVIEHPRLGAAKFNAHLNAGIEQITDTFPKVVHSARPDVIYGETVPAGKLGSNDSLVIAAITTCKVIAHQFGIEWRDIAANTVKKELVGDGRATKAVVRNAILDLFPQVDLEHIKQKQEQKTRGEKASGLPQDVFDGIAIGVIGAKLYANNDSAKKEEEV